MIRYSIDVFKFLIGFLIAIMWQLSHRNTKKVVKKAKINSFSLQTNHYMMILCHNLKFYTSLIDCIRLFNMNVLTCNRLERSEVV